MSYQTKQKKVSEQIRITLRTKSYYSRNTFVCHLEKNKYSVRTNQNKGKNKLLL
jgi:hypothetical protein